MDLPVITKADIKKRQPCSDAYAYTKLNRLVRQGRIEKIIKGRYANSDDIHVIASNLHIPSYISFWTASFLKGYTEQIVNTIQVATTREYTRVRFRGYDIMFHRMPPGLFFGYEKQRAQEHFIFISDDEKLLIDALLFQRRMGNFDEILKIAKNCTIVEERLISYLTHIGNISLNKRIGFLLERTRGIDISDRVPTGDRNYIELTWLVASRGYDAKWRVRHDFA